ncbi:hypothetical protein HAX54_010548 [Datura stramonium]|uniref:Uncharacterized protein n=1 Tax=Datura stramonium TaxID=4076 RepID=A0ABS8TGH0_DATST|nr:hypothetical protein [Datura stramonium]
MMPMETVPPVPMPLLLGLFELSAALPLDPIGSVSTWKELVVKEGVFLGGSEDGVGGEPRGGVNAGDGGELPGRGGEGGGFLGGLEAGVGGEPCGGTDTGDGGGGGDTGGGSTFGGGEGELGGVVGCGGGEVGGSSFWSVKVNL